MTIHEKINYKAFRQRQEMNIAKAIKARYDKLYCGIWWMPKEPHRNLKEPSASYFNHLND